MNSFFKIYVFLFLLIVSNISFLKSSHATLLPAGKTVGGPQVMAGMYNSWEDYFDSGVKCIEHHSFDGVEVIFNEVATVNLISNMRFEDIEKELSVGASGDISLNSGDSFGFSSEFLRKSRETNTSITFAYKTVLKAGDEILKTPYRLTKEAYNLAKVSQKDFYDYCGDQFVYKISKGARAYVVVKLEVGSLEKKNLIKNEFKIGFIDLFNMSSTLNKIKEKYEIKGDVKIYGYQEGGFAARINSIFGNGRGFTHCNSPNLNDCQMTLASVLDYFSNEFPLQFEPYYRDRFGSGAIGLPSTSFPLIYATQSYCKLPSLELPKTFECEKDNVSNRRYFQKINKLERRNLSLINQLNTIKERESSKLNNEKDKLLFKIESKLKSNQRTLQNSKILCRKDPWSCRSLVSKMEEGLNVIREKDFHFITKEDRIKVCLKSGFENTIGSAQFRFLKSESLLNPYKIYNKSDLKPNGCFYLRDPEFTMPFKGLELSVKRYTERDPRKCKLRRDKKFFSGHFWDLKELVVHNLMTNQKMIFKGHLFKEKMRCRSEKDSQGVSKWKRLTPLQSM